MVCCQNCFNCEFINTHITLKSVTIGDCEGCGSLKVSLIDSLELTDLFSPLFELYKPNEFGLPLLALIRNDWKLFIDVPDWRMIQIFKGMIYGDKDVLLKYSPIIKASELFDWEAFKEELKHENRFFPVSFPEQKELSSLLSYLSIESEHEQQELFRARINKIASELYPITSMGSPPKELATSGRANPVGISYLYVASTTKTAISEVRPHKGDYLTIAKFVGNRRLKLVDLRDPRASILPFRYSETSLRNAYKGLSLLETLGNELTKPVSQHKAQLEYLSSQYLCEFIKSQGYEGVIYKSSLGEGDNYAIFDDEYLMGVSTQLVEITTIEISHSVGN
jgi:RES domain-containing protein